MKIWSVYYCFFFFLLGISTSYAQTPAYDPAKVYAVTEPTGGITMLETFLAANVRKPLMAQVANLTGSVLVKVTVEADGKVSDLTLVRGLRPDCDREALRAMRLFRAWKPAVNGGHRVKQAVTCAVPFRSNRPINYKAGNLLTYFDANWKSISALKNAKYQVAMPVDTVTGIPNGDLVTNELYIGQWSEFSRTPLLRQPHPDNATTGASLLEMGYKPDGVNWYGLVYTIRADGSVVQERATDNSSGHSIQYYKNGAVEYITQRELSDQKKLTRWHENGHLREIRSSTALQLLFLNGASELIDAWDSTGHQQVRKGKGYMVYRSLIPSERDSTQKTALSEEGAYSAGFQDGTWKGQTADSSFFYTERFDKGKDLGGEAVRNGKRISYKTAMKNPEFVGGHNEMYKFLGKTIRYPTEARRLNISGRVYLSFTVRADGSLHDFSLLKGVDPLLDEEALRTARLMDGQWIPGYYRGKPVDIIYNLPVSFQLDKELAPNMQSVMGAYFRLRPFLR